MALKPRKIEEQKETKVMEMSDKPAVRVLVLPLTRMGSLTPDARYGPPDAPWTQNQVQNRLTDLVAEGYDLFHVQYAGETPEFINFVYHFKLVPAAE